MKKKLIAFLCALSMLLSYSVVLAEGEAGTEPLEENTSISELLGQETKVENSYIDDEAIALMKSLGVLSEDADMDKKVTRLEFAHALYLLSGYNYKSTSAVGYFTDIGITTPYYDEISVLKDHNIISGYGNSQFRPDSEVTVNEAAKMLVSLMGAGWLEAVQDKESFSYYKVASDKKLFKGVNDLNMNSITNKQMAYILLNMLESDVEKYPDKDAEGIYMNNILHIYKLEGVFSDDARTDEKGAYVIGSNKFQKPAKDYSRLLGQKTIVYYSNIDDDVNIISMTAHKSQKILELQDKNIDSYASREYKYKLDNGSIKKAKLENDFDIIYNGVKATSVINSRDFMTPKMGSVRLIDNDNDGKYEVAIIWDYKLFIVSGYSEYNTLLSSSNGEKAINLSEDKAFDILMAGTDNILSTNQIKYQDYVLSVARSANDDYVKIYLCADTVSGTVTSVNTTDRTVTIDDKEYEYEECMEAPSIVNAEFYKDQFGRLIYMKKGTDIQKKYAYVIKMYEAENADQLMIRLYSQDNQKLETPIANKCTIDGRTVSGLANIKVALDGTTGTLVRFIMNSKQEITFVDTKSNNAGAEVDGLNICYESSGSIGFNTTCMALCDTTTSMGICPLKLESIVFCVGEPYSDETAYAYTLTEFKNKYGSYYGWNLGKCIVYNTDKDSFVGEAMLNKRTWFGSDYSTSTSALKSGSVVRGISEYADEFGEIYYKITAERSEKTEEIIVSRDAIKFSSTGETDTVNDANNIYKVSKGDLIRWRTDHNNIVPKGGIRVIYDCDEDSFFYDLGKNSYTSGTSTENGRWNRLWLYKLDGEHLISYNADLVPIDTFDSSTAGTFVTGRYVDYTRDVSSARTTVWIYDRATNILEQGSIADFDYYVNSGVNCGEVLSFTNSMHRFFLIYR